MSPNLSDSVSGRGSLTVCTTARLGLVHCQAKQRPPQPRRSTVWGGDVARAAERRRGDELVQRKPHQKPAAAFRPFEAPTTTAADDGAGSCGSLRPLTLNPGVGAIPWGGHQPERVSFM